MLIERREFLRLAGLGSGAAVAAAAGLSDLLDVPEEALDQLRRGPGIETWVSTVCGQCPGGCGMRVRRVDGIPVYLRGNPVHPINQGGLCPLGHSSLQVLYNPDRIKSPLRRVGPVGSARWEPIGWDDAIDVVGSRLRQLRNEDAPHQVAYLGAERGLMHDYVARFMTAYGSPNYLSIPNPRAETVGLRIATGRSTSPAYDMSRTGLVVGFGADFLGSGHSAVYYTKLYSHLRGAGGRRTRFIQIEPRLSITAGNADRWVPIRPGTYGALALGIAHVLLREDLYDAAFVEEWTHGFDAWVDDVGGRRLGFKDVVLEDYYPERVAEITGVPGQLVIDLAREIGLSDSSVILTGEGVTEGRNGTLELIAVHSLNALLGNFGRDGGISFPDAALPPQLPPVAVDDIGQRGLRSARLSSPHADTSELSADSTDALCRNLAQGRPYSIELMFLGRGNPLFTTPGHHDLAVGLGRIPLVVSFDSFISETSQYADLILPDHTFLERWDEVSHVAGIPFAHLGIQQPVVDPVHDTRHSGDVLASLATAVGPSVSAAFGFDSYREAIRQRARSIYESGTGTISTSRVTAPWLEFLQERGWHLGSYTTFDSFWEELLERGAWWNPAEEPAGVEGMFQNRTGKYEFYASALVEELSKRFESNGTRIDDRTVLPHFEPPPAPDDNMGLQLVPFETLAMRDGSGANQPMMHEILGLEARHYWRTWAEINPETARKAGVSDGQWVWLESVIGSIRVVVRVTPGIAPDVVGVPIGLGHTSFGRYGEGHGADPVRIVKNQPDRFSGHRGLHGTSVRIVQTA